MKTVKLTRTGGCNPVGNTASFIAVALLSFAAMGTASAQTSSITEAKSASDSGAVAHTGAITFEASEQRGHTSVSTTPPVYVAPSMFAPGTCGMSDTLSASVTGFGIGGSKSKESDYCNARQDTGTAFNLGYKDVAVLRFMCFGTDENRFAYEAAGYTCPEGATAKSLRQQVADTRQPANMPEFR